MSAYRTDIMKVFVVSILFAALSGATSSSVAWPGAVSLSARAFPLSAGVVPLSARAFPLSAAAVPLSAAAIPLSASYVQRVISPQVKAFGYSTSQYINSAPSLSIGYQPQISYQSYQVPVSHYYPQHIQSLAPIVSPAYYPSSSLFYPTLTPAAPVAPAQPPQAAAPSYPTQGDEDTAIVDSADQQPQESFAPQPQAPEGGYLPPQNNPEPQPTPSFPTPAPPQSLPAADNNDQGLNDEDTISVESA